MSFKQNDIARLASLARLAIFAENDTQTPEATHFANRITNDLDRIVTLVNQINALDTESIQPMAHPLDTEQRLRPDKITESNTRADLQNLSDHVTAGLYLVPQVIE